MYWLLQVAAQHATACVRCVHYCCVLIITVSLLEQSRAAAEASFQEAEEYLEQAKNVR